MVISEITIEDTWYPQLYHECFAQEDVWFKNLTNPKYKAYHIARKAFLIIHTVDDKEIEIITIGVAHDFRRQGMAKALICHLTDKILKGAKIFLEVRSDNLSAIALYRSLNFTKISVRKNYYQNSDAVIMCFS